MNKGYRPPLWALLSPAPLCFGCAASTLHTSPRALPADKASISFAYQAGYVRVLRRQEAGPLAGKSLADSALRASVAPVYWQLRSGFGHGLEMGFRAGVNPGPSTSIGGTNFNGPGTGAGVDLKVELRRGSLDLALDPAVAVLLNDAHYSRYELPLLWGLPLGASSLLVMTTGVGYQQAPTSFLRGPVLRGGLGVRSQVSKRWAFFPEIAALQQLTGSRFTALTAGLGFEVFP